MRIFDQSSFKILEKSLDAATLRQQVISNNIANVDTPLYKKADVRFEELLNQEIHSRSIEGFRTNEKHIQIGVHSSGEVKPEVIRDQSERLMNNNRNNVDIDYEMARMAENQLKYQALVDRLNGRFSSIRTAIGGNK